MQSTKIKKTNSDTDQSRKEKNQNKFLLCFRPVVMDGLERQRLGNGGGGCGGGDPVFKCVKLENNDGEVFPQIFPTNLPSSNRESIAYTEKKGHKKNLSRLLKAILFETSLAKKIKRRKLLQKLKQSEKAEKDSNPEKNSIDAMNKEFSKREDGRNISNRNMTGSSHSSLWSSSSSSLSLNSSSSVSDASPLFRSNSSEFKPKQDNKQGNGKGFTSTIGLCLVLISLMVLVLWGKVCAILCTSTWLFLVPRCSKARNNSSQNIFYDEGIDSKEYKKKIIMEGLLERNRNHVLSPF
ncbi:hypothetical protein OIU77_015702 [Salix suchowensis]|uniref:Transmembrane protein n=1 Tax=Salix suchowensis TaxID=1278906 RepID=A0ABQ8ZHY0_9ROSI|nr:hypothetical protein OIU77_015702 [Salix suchowensis]